MSEHEEQVPKRRPKLTAFERWAYREAIYDGLLFLAAAAGWYAARGKPIPDFIKNPEDYEAPDGY